ncbi:hypothetical protein PENVUL_c030G01113 [Penicillium vulpinum]|uniref:Rhodopsin domain-containing protein n=1 Tax=Penicillium vulpinum TaxID=29845 RepID=A0A1V6RT99_9EURO|nr:hypothetical protein PENVUL_c030G01113 [Penicillium vulpinum]
MWTGKPGSCIDKGFAFKLLAIVNVITDVLILALPVRPVIQLQMETKRKVQVMGIFFLGGIVCIFGIVRCVVILKTKYGDTSCEHPSI